MGKIVAANASPTPVTATVAETDAFSSPSFSIPVAAHARRRLRVIRNEPPFPSNLLSFRNYTLVRVASLFLFALIAVRAMRGVFVPLQNDVEVVRKYEDNRGVLKRVWDTTYAWAWQREAPEEKVQRLAQSRRDWNQNWAIAELCLDFCLVWLAFDWERASHYAFAALSVSASILVTLFPLNLSQDIPVLGPAEDALVDLVGGGAGIASIVSYQRKQRFREELVRQLEDYPSLAIRSILEEYGLRALEVAEDEPRQRRAAGK